MNKYLFPVEEKIHKWYLSSLAQNSWHPLSVPIEWVSPCLSWILSAETAYFFVAFSRASSSVLPVTHLSASCQHPADITASIASIRTSFPPSSVTFLNSLHPFTRLCGTTQGSNCGNYSNLLVKLIPMSIQLLLSSTIFTQNV